MLQKQEAKKENLGKKKTIVNVVKKTLECVCVFGETALMEEEGTVEEPTRMTRTVTCIADSSVVELLSLSRINFFNVCGQFTDAQNFLQVNIHSGYRSHKTNNYLREQNNKVAKNSLHILGKAIDFSIPTRSSREVAEVSRDTTDGGVGHYASFIHLDSGPERDWRS